MNEREISMKKVIISLVAILLAAAMVFTFAACGDKDGGDATPSGDVTDVLEEATDEKAPVEDATTAEDATAAEDATTAEGETTAVEETTPDGEVAVPTEKADIVALFNEATKAAATAKPGYKKTVTTELQNLEMGAIGKLNAVRDAVGSFLGEGTETISVVKGKASNEIKTSTLTAADVTNATCKLSADGKYYEVTLTVKNETNPLKNKSALNRFTNDYKDINEMHEGLEGEGASAETITCTVQTATVKAKIAVDTKAFTALDYTIKINALLTKVNYVLTVKQATGVIYTTVKYTGFAY